MRWRIHWLPLAAFLIILLILDSTRGLAGPLSRALAFFPPILLIGSLLQLVLSWLGLSYHQTFSTDHPAKGETVAYELSVRNGLIFSQSSLVCGFAGREGSAPPAWRLFLKAGESAKRAASIVCAYRGVYRIGLTGFIFRDALGFLELEFLVEPRIFYVYPELVNLGPGLGRLASGAGEGQSAPGGGEEDAGVFEGLRQLESGRGSRRIAWKRWAARGLACEFVEAKTSAYGLRVVLDLRPPLACGDERLACEDLAVTAAYSVLKTLTLAAIPNELVLGGDEIASQIENLAAFNRLFTASTSVLFKDQRFPAAAFHGPRSVLLISTQSLVEADGEDLFSETELALRRGHNLSLLLVPPASAVETEKNRAGLANERLGGFLNIQILDSRHGNEDLIHVFAS